MHLPESVLLSLGSNIEPEKNLAEATRRLAQRVRLVAVSRVFRSKPVHDSDGPVFLNAALEIRYGHDPEDLKYAILRPLEEELGRVRTSDRNAPRTLDIDISLFGLRIISQKSPRLEIPDPEIATRAHVAVPLAELAPMVVHPVLGITLQVIADRLDRTGIEEVHGLALWPESDRLQS